MEKTLRKITVSIFFILFFILAPLLTAYSLGYRYDFSNGSIQKNGAFYVKSYPRDAEIFVDNKKNRSKTPTQVINVLPGEHELVIEKNNYISWTKNLDVYSGETTFAEDIVLFLENRPKTILGTGSDNLLINKNKDKYAFLDNDYQLLITDIEQAKVFEINTLDKSYELVDWSSDNQKILLRNDTKYFSFDIDQKELNAIPIIGIDKMIWENNSNTLIYLKENKLYRHHHKNAWDSSGQADELLDIQHYINDFAIKDKWLIIQYTFDKNNFVQQLNKNNLEIIQVINNVNLGNLDVLLAEDNNIIFTLGSKLYIKNIFRDLIVIPITIAHLHDEKLLMTNGHEIIIFNYEEDWQDLIDRSSNIVSDVFWHPNGSYFVSEINDSTSLTELDGRDKRNNIELLNNPRKKNYIFDEKGERLYIVTPEENYYLTIQ
ncbi:MAG: PEGA domain-containing protein [Candidatus Komeilibacteria bacterium]|jgi:hypothetical protein|nr:PEGA domain-containing protein [Candidatus Komeilibacteria bacterium]MBT4447774.1 PEGA domain-containing protein [Candidatus Komeilibacteria bacterium]